MKNNCLTSCKILIKNYNKKIQIRKNDWNKRPKFEYANWVCNYFYSRAGGRVLLTPWFAIIFSIIFYYLLLLASLAGGSEFHKGGGNVVWF